MTAKQFEYLTQQEKNEQVLEELYELWKILMMAKLSEGEKMEDLKEVQNKLTQLHVKNLAQQDKNQRTLKELQEVWRTLVIAKPGDRGADDRWYQIAISDIQKIIGYFSYFVVDRINDDTIATKNM